MSQWRFTVWLAVLLFLSIIEVAAAQSCYYEAGKIMPSAAAPNAYIPCSNNPGAQSCCRLGDFCMSDNACFNTKTGVTYIAGCTDSSYKDDSCPSKPCGNDNIWASLVYCNGTSNKWTCCGGDGNYPSFVDVCYCQDNSPAAFHAASTLNQMASLPYTASVAPSSSASSSADVRVATPTTRTSSSASGTTSSAASTASTASNKPSSTSALPSSSQVSTSDSKSQATTSSTAAASSDGTSSASSTTAGAPSTVSSSGASAPSQVTTSPSPSGSVVPAAGMSMGTKIGLGVGIAGGVLFIAALVMLALVWRKRRQGPQSSQYANGTPDYGIEHKDWKGNDGGAVSAFGTKAELEAPERAPASPQMMKTELSGDSARSPGPRTPAPEYREFGTPRPADDAVYEMPGHQR